MSEAGKDASARTESVADPMQMGSVPGPARLQAAQSASLANARVASERPLHWVGPQSVQLAKDHALLGQSIWCGIVFALAVVITVVNLLPPAEVGYRVTSQALVSPARFQALTKQLKHSGSNDIGARLLQVKLLEDPVRKSASVKFDEQLLIEVGSLWSERTSSGRVQRWLDELSKVELSNVAQLDAGRIERFARWEVQTRQHYLEQHRQQMLVRRSQARIGQADALASHGVADGQGDNAAGTGRSSPYADVQLGNTDAGHSTTQATTRLATLGDKRLKVSTASTILGPNSEATEGPEPLGELSADELRESAETEQKLVSALTEAQKRHDDVNSEIALQAHQLAGTLTLARPSRVRAVALRLPESQVISMLVLALACGTMGGWANHRAQSGGTFRAIDVGANMALLGLPILGRMQLPSTELGGLDGQVKRRLDHWRRWLILQFLTLSELVVLGWCMAIVVRLAFDPLWRALLLENPLAALARLFSGLP